MKSALRCWLDRCPEVLHSREDAAGVRACLTVDRKHGMRSESAGPGVNVETLNEALRRAKAARLQLLDVMEAALPTERSDQACTTLSVPWSSEQ